MHTKGFKIKFLYGAVAYPAKDDREFIAFVASKLNFKLEVHEAKTVNDWLNCIESAAIFISGRFHHTIAAAVLGTPYIILASNTPKVDGLAQVLNCEPVLRYDTANLSDILEARCEALMQIKMPNILDKLCSMATRNFAGLARYL
jgi:polysaccharide pyruvyl transferase WcaK-like protein